MDTWYGRLRAADRDTSGDADKAIGASKHQRGKRKPRNWKRARKQVRKRAKMMRRRNR